MPEELRVRIITEVVAEGEKKLDDIRKRLDQLGGKQGKANKANAQANKLTSTLNKIIGKQIPLFKSLAPAMGTATLAIGAGAAAIAAVAGATRNANQSYNEWLASMAKLTVTSAIYSGELVDGNTIKQEAARLSDTLGVSEAEIAKQLTKLIPITGDMQSAIELLVTAYDIATTTSLSLDEAVEYLGQAYSGTFYQIGAGIPAVQAMVDILRLNEDAVSGAKTKLELYVAYVKEEWNQTFEDATNTIGAWMDSIGYADAYAKAFILGLIDGSPMVVSSFDNITFSIEDCGISLDELWNEHGEVNPKILAKIDELSAGWDNVSVRTNSATGRITLYREKIDEAAESMSYFNELVKLNTAYLEENRKKSQGDTAQIDWGNASFWDKLGSGISDLWQGTFKQNSWDTVGSGWSKILKSISGAADGGITTSSGGVLVGEEGPELLNLPKGASVTPLNGGGIGGEIVIPIYIGDDLLTTKVISAFEDVVRNRGGY